MLWIWLPKRIHESYSSCQCWTRKEFSVAVLNPGPRLLDGYTSWARILVQFSVILDFLMTETASVQAIALQYVCKLKETISMFVTSGFRRNAGCRHNCCSFHSYAPDHVRPTRRNQWWAKKLSFDSIWGCSEFSTRMSWAIIGEMNGVF